MTLEDLEKQKEKYRKKMQYFLAIGFDSIASDFQKMIELIDEMEDYIKKEEENESGEDNQN